MYPVVRNVLFFAAGCFLTAVFFSCREQSVPRDAAAAPVPAPLSGAETAAAAVLSQMSIEEKIGQMLLVGVDGDTEVLPVTEDVFRDTVPGGVLLFGYNIGSSPAQVIRYVESLKDFFTVRKNGTEPFIVIDHEGGDVNRLKKIVSPLPSAAEVAASMSVSDAESLYMYTAGQLSALGITVALAPVAENAMEEGSFLGSRLYGSPENVVSFASAAVRGFRRGGVLSVAKHFPGHAAGDPHEDIPVLDITARELEDFLKPFSAVIADKPDGILMSHVLVPSADPVFPACLSPVFVNDMLRGEMGYDGLVFSDDILMAALRKNGFPAGTAAILAVEAGVDVIMICSNRIEPVYGELLQKARADEAFMQKVDEAVLRILAVKCRNKMVPGAGVPAPVQLSAEDRGKLFDIYFRLGKNLTENSMEK